MLKHYIKQAIQLIRENRLVSCISMIGTAISIAMMMLIVLVIQIQVANYYPENKRDRMLFVEGIQAKSSERSFQGNMSVETARQCFYELKTPEAVTAFGETDMTLSLPEKQSFREYRIKQVDPAFWQIFSFRFLAGKAFSKADFDAGIQQAVISETTARYFFGATDIVGRELKLDRKNYRVCGVVKDVSKAASTSYANVWIPYTCDPEIMRIYSGNDNISGKLKVAILAHSDADFEAIRNEIRQRQNLYNQQKESYQVSFFDNPITQWDKAHGSDGFHRVSWTDYWMETGGVLLFLLLVPAFNLLGVTQASVRKRQTEIGVRKAFGATDGVILKQILYENGVLTFLGGIVGLLLSLVAFPLCKDFLLRDSGTSLSGDMVFQPSIFLVALLFCFLLNFLSAGLPAWHISRKAICEALKG